MVAGPGTNGLPLERAVSSRSFVCLTAGLDAAANRVHDRLLIRKFARCQFRIDQFVVGMNFEAATAGWFQLKAFDVGFMG